jgi:hypothetical protein
MWYTDSQTFCSVALRHSPELVSAVNDFFVAYTNPFLLSYATTAASYVFSDYSSSLIQRALNLAALICLAAWLGTFFFSILRLLSWHHALEAYSTRLTLYLASLSKENRIQVESLLLTTLLFTTLFALNLITFKDLTEESSEALSVLLFKVFLVVYLFFLYKNSTHYLPFLEASLAGRSTVSVLIQFVKDFANSFVLLLRFLTLLFRLNIYDAVDDVLDSNYIFICDFEEDSFFADTLATFYRAVLINTDLFGDKTVFFEPNLDASYDLFATYFLICSKFVSLIVFFLEEVGRVLLAFFIVYLVIFEMQSVNRSYAEDLFTTNRRKRGF